MTTEKKGLVDSFVGIVVAMVVIVAFVAGFAVGRSVTSEGRDDPPCRYGAVETMVREQSGKARVVCACSRQP